MTAIFFILCYGGAIFAFCFWLHLYYSSKNQSDWINRLTDNQDLLKQIVSLLEDKKDKSELGKTLNLETSLNLEEKTEEENLLDFNKLSDYSDDKLKDAMEEIEKKNDFSFVRGKVGQKQAIAKELHHRDKKEGK